MKGNTHARQATAVLFTVLATALAAAQDPLSGVNEPDGKLIKGMNEVFGLLLSLKS